MPHIEIDDLLMRLDFRDPSPAVVDISPEGGVVATLQESKVECLSADKVCSFLVLIIYRMFNLYVPSFVGRVPLLLPLTIPRTDVSVPILHRWHPKTTPAHGSPTNSRVSSSLTARAAPTAEES